MLESFRVKNFYAKFNIIYSFILHSNSIDKVKLELVFLKPYHQIGYYRGTTVEI